MKINGLKGESSFYVLYKNLRLSDFKSGWHLSTQRYFTLEEAHRDWDGIEFEIKWPAEVWEDGSVYIPTMEELNEEK